MTDHENESEIEEIVNPGSDDKLYQMLAGRSFGILFLFYSNIFRIKEKYVSIDSRLT